MKAFLFQSEEADYRCPGFITIRVILANDWAAAFEEAKKFVDGLRVAYQSATYPVLRSPTNPYDHRLIEMPVSVVA